MVHYRGAAAVPAPSVHVYLWGGPVERQVLLGEAQTDAEGRFKFEGVRTGKCSFSTWTAEGEGWQYSRDAVTVEGGQTVLAELRVDRPLAPEARVRVTGTVAYDDGRAVGKFRFRLQAEGRLYVVEGRDGRFECVVRRAGEYHVYDVEADGERREDERTRITITREEPVSLVLEIARDRVLWVVDRETGAPLPTARAYRGEGEESAYVYRDFPNPASRVGTPVVADDVGRIRLGRFTGRRFWFVVADGHAWRMVETAKGQGGTRVALDPGGTVRLSVEGWAGLADARVMAEASAPYRRWTLTRPGADGEGVYEGIPAGTWKFQVRRGWSHQRGEVYGEGTVEVLAGRESRLVIPTRPSAAEAPVGVTGTVTVPAAWGLRGVRLYFEGAEPTNASVDRMVYLEIPPDGAAVPFRLDPLPPGGYDVQVDAQWYTTVRVPPEGGRFDFRLPKPGVVLVRVVDDASGEALDDASVSWHTEAGRTGYGLSSADRTEVEGEFRILAPAGRRVALSVSAPGHVPASVGGLESLLRKDERARSIEVPGEGESRVTIRLRRAGAVRIVFRWEGEGPRWEDAMVQVVEGREDRRGRGYFVNVKDGRGTREGLEPGAYRVTVGFPGRAYESPEGVPIEVKAGETTEVVVALRRKR